MKQRQACESEHKCEWVVVKTETVYYAGDFWPYEKTTYRCALCGHEKEEEVLWDG